MSPDFLLYCVLTSDVLSICISDTSLTSQCRLKLAPYSARIRPGVSLSYWKYLLPLLSLLFHTAQAWIKYMCIFARGSGTGQAHSENSCFYLVAKTHIYSWSMCWECVMGNVQPSSEPCQAPPIWIWGNTEKGGTERMWESEDVEESCEMVSSP